MMKTIALGLVKKMFQIDDMQVNVSRANLKKTLSDPELKKIILELSVLEKKEYQNCHFLLLDARAIAGIEHLKACIHYSLQAFKQKNNLAKTINAEILVYLSGYRQISRAIELVGLCDTSKEIVLVIYGQNLDNCVNFNLQTFLAKFSVELLEYSKDIDSLPLLDESRIKSNLGISDEEITTFLNDPSNINYKKQLLEKIAIEKSALINLQK